MPLLLRWGLVETWLGLGAISLVLTAAAWQGWPTATGVSESVPTASEPRPAAAPLRALYLEYALNAVGLVPHMVFLVDFIARHLGRGLYEAAWYWILFGAGALVGPLIGGHAGDRIGFRAALRLAFLVQALCVALPYVTGAAAGLAVSSFVVGAFVPGIVAIAIGRTRELVHGDPRAQAAAWSFCTVAFALGQAVAGYAFSYIFSRSEDAYPLLFLLAAAALLLALASDIIAGKIPKARAVSGRRPA